MSSLLPVVVEGQTIYFEVESSYGSEETASVEELLERGEHAFACAKATITNVAKGMVDTIRGFDNATAPNEFTLEVGIKFNAEGNAIVAKAGGDANLKVSMKYKHA